MALYPLLVSPELHRRVWGGQRLGGLHGPDVPVVGAPGEPVGESWLLGGGSVVRNGPLAGRTLEELAAEYGPRLVGTVPHARYGGRLPLLLKLLDAAQPLSVQVHPDDAYALEHEAATGHLGKSEAWYVLEAQAGATVLWGFKQPITAQELRAAAEDGTLPRLMHQLPVGRGAVVVNPPGTVHAVGAGIMLFEIQQSSDLTYRIFDYGRLGADGRPRQLHLDKAVAVADLSGAPYAPTPPVDLGDGWSRVVRRPEFVLDRAVLGAGGGNAEAAGPSASGSPRAPGAVSGRVSPTSLETLTVVAGEATLSLGPVTLGAAAGADPAADAPFEPLLLRFGDSVLLPAGLARAYSLTGHGEVLRGAVAKGPDGPGSGPSELAASGSAGPDQPA